MRTHRVLSGSRGTPWHSWVLTGSRRYHKLLRTLRFAVTAALGPNPLEGTELNEQVPPGVLKGTHKCNASVLTGALRQRLTKGTHGY